MNNNASLTLRGLGVCSRCYQVLFLKFKSNRKGFIPTTTILFETLHAKEIQRSLQFFSQEAMASTALQVVVSPFLAVVYDNLSSLIQKEVGLVWGVHREMQKLSSTLSTIRCVLEDAEEKQQIDKAIGNWLRKLKDAAYDADDILDEWSNEAMQLEQVTRDKTCTKQVCDSFLSCFNIEQINFRCKTAKRINELQERFDDIAAERAKFHLRQGVVERRIESFLNRESSSILTEPQVYGRDEEKENIVQLLLGNVDTEDLSICPILGIGGLGKTTVAQLFYNDERVKEHFEIRIWVCVSEDFDLKRLTKAVIASMSGDSSCLQDLDTLQCCLQGKLTGKRFLLVFDDVWNENQEEWNKFKNSIRVGARGSSIVVTTRLKTVASIVGTSPAISLKFLSEDDCWFLFKQRAFGTGNEESSNLVKIGKEIVKKCGGVPLAAKALGGLLRFESNQNEWLLVRDSDIWNLPQNNDNTLLPALRLSYSHLPPYLRQCFAYCSIYPKDYRMQKEEVIHLWMANGLFQSKERIQLEETANNIFNALLWRSFFQDVEKNEDGNILSVRMHDLIHDLACSIMMYECSSLKGCQIRNIPKGTRHLSVTLKTSPSSPIVHSIYQSAPNMHTLILFNQRGIELPTHFIFSTFKSLRALSLGCSYMRTLHDSISNLKHLRYLKLSEPFLLTSLPESISLLRNLQTLKLKDCFNLQTLPKDLRNLSSLRHLDIRGCHRLTQMPSGLGQLTCLQTLSVFIVSSDTGRHVKELQGLEHLRGELVIKGLENVRSSKYATEANLTRKQNLHSLGLAWSDSHLEEENDTDVLEGLQPHQNTRRLSITRFLGVMFPSWLDISFLPNLVELSLSSCNRCEYLPSLGKLPLLKTLRLHAMYSVKVIDSEGVVNGFPSLEELELDDMPKLEEWSSMKEKGGVQVILLPSHKKLSIQECPLLNRLPLSSSLEHLVVKHCTDMVLQTMENLHCLSSLTISGFVKQISFREGMLRNLTALQTLSISSCKKLKTLLTGVENLGRLTCLEISYCAGLVSLPKELSNLSSLKVLEVRYCHDLKSLPEFPQSSLRDLNVYGCSSMTSLSEGLKYQTALQNLDIFDCPKLDYSKVKFQYLVSLQKIRVGGLPEFSLPDGIQHVSRLQRLHISDCPALISIPEWIGSLTKLQSLYIFHCKNLTFLPEGLQHLTNLTCLWIKACHPELHRRCKKEKGEDWHKIAHVPNLTNSQHSEEKGEKKDGNLNACFGRRRVSIST